jgi:hypothetical protein
MEAPMDENMTEETPVISTRDALILEAYNDVPFGLNFITILSLWLLLTGFVVFPTAIPLIASSSFAGAIPKQVLRYTDQHMSILLVGSITFGLGITGLSLVWYFVRTNFRGNPIWLKDNLFL